MKKKRSGSNLAVFLAGAVITAVFFSLLSFIDVGSHVRSFFYRSWYIQSITTWLFSSSVFFILLKFIYHKREKDILNKHLIPEDTDSLNVETVKKLLESIPAKFKNAISMRRVAEVLRGYVLGEGVIKLNNELSRRDYEQIENGHSLLNTLKQLIPVLGFLGTVLGLSMGIVKFPEMSASALNIESLRYLLKDFAASLSVAFDTTLLALGYSVILVLISSLLRSKEEALIDEVDSKTRKLISKLNQRGDNQEKKECNLDGVVQKLEQIAAQNEKQDSEVSRALHAQRDIAAEMLENLKSMAERFEKINSEKDEHDAVVMSGLQKHGAIITEMLNSVKSMAETIAEISKQNSDHEKEVAALLREQGRDLVSKLHEISENIHTLPQYELIVQPANGKGSGNGNGRRYAQVQ